jgi:hypothetical protein
MIDELTAYLEREADRVEVRDSLDDLESGVAAVPVGPRRRGVRWFAPALVGTAAALVVVIGVAAGSDPRSPAADVGDTPVPVEQTPAPSAAPVLTPTPLPDGGTFQGFAPTCTTVDNLEFECIVEGYGDGHAYGAAGVDWSGYQYNIVSADGIVIGGCLTTAWDSATATVTAHCAVGERAVEQNLVYPPALGQPAQRGWANG